MSVSSLGSAVALGPAAGRPTSARVVAAAGGELTPLPDLGPGYLYLQAGADNVDDLALHGSDAEGEPSAEGFPIPAGTPLGPLYVADPSRLQLAGAEGDVLHVLHLATNA